MGKKRKAALRFVVPFQADPPPLNTAGITKLVERRSASKEIDVTILDSADNRLLRAGIVLAHRVVDSLGGWYLAAPDWEPLLPAEASSPIGATAELPEEFAALTRPFLRRAPLGPVAALECRRREYQLRADTLLVGVIRDEQVTVRRGGIATARYREATIESTAAMTGGQRRALTEVMEQISATRVTQFPSLQERLGPPATGGTDFPDPGPPPGRGATLEAFVRHVFAGDLRALIPAYLGDDNELGEVLADVAGLARGLAAVLDPAWLREFEAAMATPNKRVGTLEIIDFLVGAVRAPRLGHASREVAADLLSDRARQGARILADRCRALTADSPNENWGAATQAAQQLRASVAVASRLYGKRGRRMIRHVADLAGALARAARIVETPDLAGVSVDEAFRLGCETERLRQEVAADRAQFVEQWPRRAAEVRELRRKERR